MIPNRRGPGVERTDGYINWEILAFGYLEDMNAHDYWSPSGIEPMALDLKAFFLSFCFSFVMKEQNKNDQLENDIL
jgi:hypothetical protein